MSRARNIKRLLWLSNVMNLAMILLAFVSGAIMFFSLIFLRMKTALMGFVSIGASSIVLMIQLFVLAAVADWMICMLEAAQKPQSVHIKIRRAV